MTTAESSSLNNLPKKGSPQSGGPVFLTIGKLQRTHGVKGEIVMELMTDFPEKILPGNIVFIGSKQQPYEIASVRPAADKMLISFKGFNDCDQVSILRNQVVSIKTEDANQLPEGEFYHHEIIGMTVVEEDGKLVGSIEEILVTGANDVYIIKNENGEELLLPAIKDAVRSIDRRSRKMVVKLPEWE
ncbi:MAG TPA: 16S rRNA processing protein RimM [Anaerolineaceae bacterium]|nr:16S rRNA processing protein RimM [Anaerolineaceae bacterium]